MVDKKDDISPMAPTPTEVRRVETAHDKGMDENDRAWAEREAAGFAPRFRLDDTRPREVKEAETRKAMGYTPVQDDFLAGMEPELTQLGPSVKTSTGAEEAEEYNRLRAAPGYSGSGGEIREITVNGVTVKYRAGDEAKLPAAHAEVLRQSMDPMNTAQMRGADRAVIDLT